MTGLADPTRIEEEPYGTKGANTVACAGEAPLCAWVAGGAREEGPGPAEDAGGVAGACADCALAAAALAAPGGVKVHASCTDQTLGAGAAVEAIRQLAGRAETINKHKDAGAG